MPRMTENPSPDAQLANLMSCSGCTSITDEKFARYLDGSDQIGYMRFNFAIPTIESMNRQPQPTPPPTPNPEVIAWKEKLRVNRDQEERSADQPGDNEPYGKQQTTSIDDSRREDQNGSHGHTSSTASLTESRTSFKPQKQRDQQARPSNAANGHNQAELGANNQLEGLDSLSAPEAHEMVVYLAGNSLGLPSKQSLQFVQDELNVWQEKAVTGWFAHSYKRPWASLAERLSPMMAGIIGCNETEVICMGNLTANLHLLLCSFYRPTKDRFKIMYEAKAFPSDNYAFASQVEMHGFNKRDALIAVKPKDGEYTLRTEDILESIDQNGDHVAVVIFSGINYFSGQAFEMQKITEAAHKKGCLVGFDLAHAVGNLILRLHDWAVDFAVWCTYKYLNSGPGGVAGLYVHEKHSDRPRLCGWWGNDLKTRFTMAEDFDPAPGAAGFQTSTPSILSLACLMGSLESFLMMGKEESAQQETPANTQIAMRKLRKKSVILTSYLVLLLKASKYYVPLPRIVDFEKSHTKSNSTPGYTIITPDNPEHRGAQLSILLLPRNNGLLPPVSEHLMQAGVYGDEREPDVIRFSPVPMYNTYRDCWIAAETLDWAVKRAAIQRWGDTKVATNGAD